MRVGRFIALLTLGLLVLLADFCTKAYALHLLPHYPPSSIYPYGGIGVFHNLGGIDFALQLTFNRGAAWGVLSTMHLPLLIVRIAILAALLAYLFLWSRRPSEAWGLVLIAAGALGNIADFFLYGYVIDFLHFTFWGWHFPIFNLADTAISVGAGLLLLQSMLARRSRADA